MFGWRKKNDGFVWHDYVRTTILVRRDRRRKHIEDLREGAIEGVKQAGKQGTELTAAGARMAALAAVRASARTYYWVSDALIAGASATWLWLSGWLENSRFAALASGAWHAVWQRWCEEAEKPAFATPALLIGTVCALSAVARWRDHGFDVEGVITSSLAVAALLFIALPRIATAFTSALPWPALRATLWPRSFSPDLGYALKLLALVCLAAGLMRWLVPALTSETALAPNAADGRKVLVAASGTVQGKATVVSGAHLRVGGTLVRLFGIEAPEAGQTCVGAGRKQESCALAAKTALQKLVAGKLVSCELSSRQSEAAAVATCTVNGADIAGQLVRGGSVFAESGLFSTYASAEREANAARAGVWRSGAARPAEYRAKVWDEAKDQAPDGCPIKALVNGEAKTYLVPWAANYDRAKVKASRGERWFCTEAEARAAGWVAAVSE